MVLLVSTEQNVAFPSVVT